MDRYMRALPAIIIFWIFLMCFIFGFGSLDLALKNGDSGKFLGDMLIIAIVLFGGLSWAGYEVQGWFDEANRPRNRDDDDHKGPGSGPTSPNGQ